MQSEKTIIGACLENHLARLDALAALRPSDFALDACGRVFAAIERMAQKGIAVDTMTVSSELRDSRELDAVGGLGFLLEALNSVPRNCAIQEHIASVLNDSTARRGADLCHQAQQRFLDPSERAAEVLDELVRDITLQRPSESMSAKQVLATALDVEVCQIIPTGISELDEILSGGIRTKQFTVIGAKPSGGKSALCRQIERSAAGHGFGIHAHSIEVPKETWLLHHAANLSGVPNWKLNDRTKLSVTEKSYLRGWSDKIGDEWNYFIDDAGSVNIDALIAKSRLSVMRHGIKLVTVDYLQRISGNPKLSRHLQMSEIAGKLAEFAKTYDVAVLALSQISRTGDPNARPSVESLKESGDIEAAANVILLNYRPKNEHGEYSGLDEILIGKQRDGRVGTLDMFFDYNVLSFRGRTDGGAY
jgi:replicative DNA helicase